MSLLAYLATALLNAIAASIVAGLIAAQCVEWYHISSREGAAGYFVVLIGFFGAIAGFFLGLIAGKAFGGPGGLGLLRALGGGVGALILLGGIAYITAQLLADIPPKINGEKLLLAVEVRWPEGSHSPAEDNFVSYIHLHSVTRLGHTARVSERGALWKSDAKWVDGRWVVPGAVEIFTSRGKRMLEIELDEKTHEYFEVRVPGSPKTDSFEWSPWIPRPRENAPANTTALPTRFTFRYRVQPTSIPVRSETVGPFTVLTRVFGFYDRVIGGRGVLSANSRFEIRHGLDPLVFQGEDSPSQTRITPFTLAKNVSVLPGPTPALLVVGADPSGTEATFVARENHGKAEVQMIGVGDALITAKKLPESMEEFQQLSDNPPLLGYVDRTTFRLPGLYRFTGRIFDSRTLQVYRFDEESPYLPIPAVPPLAVSPDGRSFVSYAYAEHTQEKPVLAVTDFVANQIYALPIDPNRMRYSEMAELTPAWIQHHFTWQRDAAGIDRLVERKDFKPIPWKGKVVQYGGEGPSYTLEPALPELRDALLAFVVEKYGGKRLPADTVDYEHRLEINGEIVIFAYSKDFITLRIMMDRAFASSSFVTKLVPALEAELATGKYDPFFGYGGSSYRH